MDWPRRRLPKEQERWWLERIRKHRDAAELRVYLKYRSLTDLVFFGRVVLGYDLLGDPYHYHLAWHLARWPKLFKLLMGGRETYKSVLCNTTWCVREIIKDPNVSIVQGGEDETIARKGLRSISRHFEHNDRLRDLFGDFVSADEWSQERLVVSKRTRFVDNPTVQISSPEITRTGAHPEIIVNDDLEGERCFKSDAYNLKTKAYFRAQFGMLRKPHGRMLCVNSPWRWDGYCLGEIANRAGGLHQLFDIVAVPIETNGKFVMPEVYDEKRLDDLVIQFGIEHVSMQYRLWPMTGDMRRFDPVMMRANIVTRVPKPMHTYLLLDPGGGVKMTNDPSGISIVGMPPGREVYVIHAENVRWDVLQVCRRVLELAKLAKCKAIAVEANAGLVAYGPTLERLMKESGGERIRVVVVEPAGRAKHARIGHLIGLWDAGLLKVMANALPFIHEMQTYGAGPDNVLDATAYYRDIPGIFRPTAPVEMTLEEAERAELMRQEQEMMEELLGGPYAQAVLVDGAF